MARGVILTLTLLSPPPVANLALSPFWKSAEYMGALDSCQLMIRGVLFMVDGWSRAPNVGLLAAVVEPPALPTYRN